MERMTRTQISLCEDEYDYVKQTAVRRGISLSAVLRALVRTDMEKAETPAATVADLLGLFSDPAAEGRDHDALLYGSGPAADGWPMAGGR
jgi:hypothetical protein